MMTLFIFGWSNPLFIKMHSKEYLLFHYSQSAPRSRLHGMINLISSCNYFIILRKWPHWHQAVDYWQLYKHFLYYMSWSQQLPYTHSNTHIHNAVGILCHLANSQQSLFLRWRLFHVIGPSVVMTLHLFSPSRSKSEKGNLVWHGAQKMY